MSFQRFTDRDVFSEIWFYSNVRTKMDFPRKWKNHWKVLIPLTVFKFYQKIKNFNVHYTFVTIFLSGSIYHRYFLEENKTELSRAESTLGRFDCHKKKWQFFFYPSYQKKTNFCFFTYIRRYPVFMRSIHHPQSRG